jgi:Asp/Glu/hydantoin racemase
MALVRGGRAFYGNALGILMLNMKAPLIPGNVGNATSYRFPVRFKIIDLPADWWCDAQGPDEKRLEIYVRAAKELEAEGVRAITSGCGFFAIYQKKAAARLHVPLFASPLLMVPMVSRMIGGRRVGIISAGGGHLSQGQFLENVGIDPSISLAIEGLENTEEFYKVHVTEEKQVIDTEKFEKEVVDAALAMVKKHPDIGAIVLECSDIPPHAHAVARATGLPVFDFISLAHMVYAACLPRPYEGFM